MLIVKWGGETITHLGTINTLVKEEARKQTLHPVSCDEVPHRWDVSKSHKNSSDIYRSDSQFIPRRSHGKHSCGAVLGSPFETSANDDENSDILTAVQSTCDVFSILWQDYFPPLTYLQKFETPHMPCAHGMLRCNHWRERNSMQQAGGRQHCSDGIKDVVAKLHQTLCADATHLHVFFTGYRAYPPTPCLPLLYRTLNPLTHPSPTCTHLHVAWF